jgi:hypothetical protein
VEEEVEEEEDTVVGAAKMEAPRHSGLVARKAIRTLRVKDQRLRLDQR